MVDASRKKGSFVGGRQTFKASSVNVQLRKYAINVALKLLMNLSCAVKHLTCDASEKHVGGKA